LIPSKTNTFHRLNDMTGVIRINHEVEASEVLLRISMIGSLASIGGFLLMR